LTQSKYELKYLPCNRWQLLDSGRGRPEVLLLPLDKALGPDYRSLGPDRNVSFWRTHFLAP